MQIHKAYILLFLTAVLFQNCKEEEPAVDPFAQLKADKNSISEYVAAHQIPGSFTSDGLFYSVLKEGAGAAPVVRNGMYVKYTEKLMNGAFIDSGKAMYQYGLDENFRGYNMSLALLKKGGLRRFFVPSDYAFGSGSGTRKNVTIPPFAIMDLTLEVLDMMEEDSIIDSYLKYNNRTATKTASGLYYYLTQSGTGARVKELSTVTVNYQGAFLNNVVFDPGSKPLTFKAGTGSVIAGFDEGIQLLKQGDKAVLIMPYHLGYGAAGVQQIPGFAILKFAVEVTAVQ